MYAAYTVHQDINTVAYKSGILYIQKHNVKMSLCGFSYAFPLLRLYLK